MLFPLSLDIKRSKLIIFYRFIMALMIIKLDTSVQFGVAGWVVGLLCLVK